MTTIQIFRKMFDYLVANKLIPNQTELARATGLNEVSVSRILNGQVKKTKQETLWKVNVAFGNVFNPDWLRGESDVMLLADLSPVSADGPANNDMTDGDPSGQSPTPSTLDAMTATLLAAKDETIAALKRELVGKDDIIAAKDDVIASKEALIDTLQQQLSALRAQLAIEKGLLVDGYSLSELVEKQVQDRQSL